MTRSDDRRPTKQESEPIVTDLLDDGTLDSEGDVRREQNTTGQQAPLNAETLEPRILLSATWIDADTGDLIEDATDGDDVFIGDYAADVANGLGGNDQIFGGGGADNLQGGGGNDVVDGGEGGDTLSGGSGNDQLTGGQGNDQLNGAAGADDLQGGGGNDVLDGGEGADTLAGGSGSDQLVGGLGNDQLDGGSGADILQGGAGNDVLDGGEGADILNGGSGNDRLTGGVGNDALAGGDGADSLQGGAGNDVLDGGEGADTLDGGLGNDQLDGGAGSDWLSGGAGDDVFSFEDAQAGDVYTVDGGDDNDVLDLNAYSVDDAQIESDRLIVDIGGGGSFTILFSNLETAQFADGTVSLINVAPVASGDAFSTFEDTPITTENVLANDVDDDGDSLSVTDHTQGTNGTVSYNGDGTFTYTPDANFHGSDSFTYTVDDGNGNQDTATVAVTVEAVEDAPEAVDDAVTTDEDTSVTTGNVLANDSDADGDTLTIDSFTQGSNGTVVNNGDGTLSYTPNADFNGTDSFTYTVDDGNGNFDTAIVNVIVNAVNDAPILTAVLAQDIEAGSSTVITLSAGDVDGDSVTYSAVVQGYDNTAYELDQQLNLYTNGNLWENWGGIGEKWVLGNGAQWYFITPVGEFYLWDGSGSATGTLIATLDASYHTDPSTLYNAQLNPPPATVSVDGDELTVTVREGATGTFDVVVTASDGTAQDEQTFAVDIVPVYASFPYTEDFTDGDIGGLVPSVGNWNVVDGQYDVTGSGSGQNGLALVNFENPLPASFEIDVQFESHNAPGQYQNSFVIFDYNGPDDFKFAGARVGANYWTIGHYDGSNWVDDSRINEQISTGAIRDVQVEIDGAQVTLNVDGVQKASHDFGGNVNGGQVGIGVDHADTSFDNLQVGLVPDPVEPVYASFPYTEDFTDGDIGGLVPSVGNWNVVDGQYDVTGSGSGQNGLALVNFENPLPASFEIDVQFESHNAPGQYQNSFVIFDYNGPDDFKFAGARVGANYWTIGHYDGSNWVNDSRINEQISTGAIRDVQVEIDGGHVTLNVDGIQKASHDFGGNVNGGQVGIGVDHADTSFDNLRIASEAGVIAKATEPVLEDNNNSDDSDPAWNWDDNKADEHVAPDWTDVDDMRVLDPEDANRELEVPKKLLSTAEELLGIVQGGGGTGPSDLTLLETIVDSNHRNASVEGSTLAEGSAELTDIQPEQLRNPIAEVRHSEVVGVKTEMMQEWDDNDVEGTETNRWYSRVGTLFWGFVRGFAGTQSSNPESSSRDRSR